MEPSFKTPEMEASLTEMFGQDRREFITRDICTWCKAPAKEFRDDISRKEFAISGLCQSCQDKVFPPDAE